MRNDMSEDLNGWVFGTQLLKAPFPIHIASITLVILQRAYDIGTCAERLRISIVPISTNAIREGERSLDRHAWC